MIRTPRRRALQYLLVVSLASHLGCKRSGATSSESSGPALPEVTAESQGLLFTWIDDVGEFHVEQRVADVPEAARELVRVAGPNDPAGDAIFLVDLRKPGPDGRFPVRTGTRLELEAAALARRGTGPALTAAPASAQPRPSGDVPPSVGTTAAVIIYGASWCGPCHQAAAHFKRRGVRFVEKDIEEDADAAREMRAKLAKAGMRGGSIPVIDVRGKLLLGFSAAAVDAALAAAP